jgi:hypothetical protein
VVALLVVATIACNRAPEADGRAKIDREAIDPAVVAWVAERDGLDETAARAKVIETLRHVAAARAERSDGAPELDPVRAAHLRRTALARLVLREEFERTHRAADIPDDDPLLVRARAPGRYVHPKVHDVCQVLVTPTNMDPSTLDSITADAAWRVRADALLEPTLRHLRATIDLEDPHACELVARDMPLELKKGDGIELRYERGGFDLDACGEPLAADGTCNAPQWDPDWVAAVREGEVPGWRGPFYTRFGVHFALVQQILPANMPDSEGFESRLREAILRDWQAVELQRWLTALRTEYAAQTVIAAEDGAR